MTEKKIPIKSIAAIMIGNGLEWYDFIVYSFMTVYLAKIFFPSSNHFFSLLLATATFGAAFLMRPLGGMLLGLYADTYGRKAAITLVIVLMTIAIALIAFTPTYHQIGSTASFIILSARMLQGLSAGGEFGPSSAAIIELAPNEKRGFIGACLMIGQMIASLLASSVGMLLMLLSTEQIEAWGWRIPFIVGLVIAPVGVYIRHHLDLSQIDDIIIHHASEKMIMRCLVSHWKELIIMMGLVVGGTVAIYASIAYFPTYTVKELHLTMDNAFLAIFIGTLFRIILAPFWGWLSDQIGTKKILLATFTLYILCIYPIFAFITNDPSAFKLIIAQMLVGILISGLDGVFVSAVTSLFPSEIRSTALSIGYNLTVLLFGGFAQFIVTWLIHATHNPISITYYIIFANIISLAAALRFQEKDRDHEFCRVAYETSRI